MKAILSIKPEYVERILSGEKTYEFRRRIFKREDVDTLVVYATSPQRRVVAEARIAGIMESTPEDIWRRTSDRGGISRDRFMDYFAGRDTAYAIELRDVRRLERPMLLSDYAPGVRSAPQSFVYINQDSVPGINSYLVSLLSGYRTWTIGRACRGESSERRPGGPVSKPAHAPCR